jgi:hypothetical protein
MVIHVVTPSFIAIDYIKSNVSVILVNMF